MIITLEILMYHGWYISSLLAGQGLGAAFSLVGNLARPYADIGRRDLRSLSSAVTRDKTSGALAQLRSFVEWLIPNPAPGQHLIGQQQQVIHT